VSDNRSALDALSAAEKAAVLDELLAARPDLRQPAEAYAARVMSGADRSAAAGDVEDSRGDPMTEHYRWETALDQRRRADPGIDDPDRRAAARDIRNARDIGYHLAQMRKQRSMTQAEVARAMGVSQARVSRMEHGDVEKMQVESVAAYVAAIGGHLRLVADFDQATTTFIDYTDALTA
jgi:predicted XRE-type DNA-binding protein